MARFVAPIEGMRVLNRSDGQYVIRTNGIWESGVTHVAEVRIDGQTVLRQRQAAVLDPSGGTVIDYEMSDCSGGHVGGDANSRIDRLDRPSGEICADQGLLCGF